MLPRSAKESGNGDNGDAMSTYTSRTDRTRDLVIPYEAGRTGGMVASPRRNGAGAAQTSAIRSGITDADGR